MPGPIDIDQPVAAPAAVVWDLITDIDNAAQNISGITEVQRLDDGTGFGVGTRGRETRVMFGRSATEVMAVTEVDPGRSYTTLAEHGSTRYTSSLTVEPTGPDSCVLSMHFDAEVTGLLNKTLGVVVGKLMESTTRKLMRQDLVDIATAAERRRS